MVLCKNHVTLIDFFFCHHVTRHHMTILDILNIFETILLHAKKSYHCYSIYIFGSVFIVFYVVQLSFFSHTKCSLHILLSLVFLCVFIRLSSCFGIKAANRSSPHPLLPSLSISHATCCISGHIRSVGVMHSMWQNRLYLTCDLCVEEQFHF